MLLAAIAAAVFAVGYYAKRITAPPMQTSFPNVHLASLRADLARLDKQPTMEVADSVFNVTLHAARYFQREGLVTTKESDDVIVKLTKKYVPFFLKSAEEHFNSNIWPESRNFELCRRAKLLSGLRTQEDHQPILADELRASVDSVTNTIIAYDEAKELCRQTYFNNLADVKDRLAQADAYAKMPRLRNCSALADNLKSMRSRLEEAHYNHVRDKVREMSYYHSYTESEFDDLAREANAAIAEYERSAYQTYGQNRSMENLKEWYDNYFTKAKTKYKQDREESNPFSSFF